jgi:hypothetical protein
MFENVTRFVSFLLIGHLWSASAVAQWQPPSEVPREEIVKTSERILAMPDIPLKIEEDIFRIPVLAMEWDVGGMVYQPEDPSRIPRGPDGKKIGVFVIHGGGSDYRSKDDVARLLATKFGLKVVVMSFPGTIYLLDPSRDWPGDTFKEDGSLRMPIWNKDKPITPDQYEVVEDKSMRPKYGTMSLACAKEGTEFYNRMSGWPLAFEEAGKSLMRRHFPSDEYSIYIHGHSTGGPFAFMFTQRVQNIVGVLGMETSPFGAIYRVQSRPSGHPQGKTRADLPFNCLHVYKWQITAMYVGAEALMLEGPEALMRLPMLMEEVYERWEKRKKYPQFKYESPVHFGGRGQLAGAARATARRLDLSLDKTQELVERYVGYVDALRGPGVKPVPPIIFGMTSASAGHEYKTYQRITLPMFAGMDPAPKVRLVAFDAGVHGYSSPQTDLPMGPFPAVAELWYEAIVKGYYSDQMSGF